MDFGNIKATRTEIERFCADNKIEKVGHEFHFVIGGQNYIVGPWLVNVREGKRKKVPHYEIDERQHKYVMIRASQKKLIQIYNDLSNGYKLSDTGERI